MHLAVVISVILYEVLVIIGVSAFLNYRMAQRQMKLSGADFVSSSSSMGVIAVGATMALTSLGGGHILGMPGQAPYTGIGTYWYILSSGMMLVILCCYVGPWYIRLKVTTVTELFEKMFDRKAAIILAGLTAGCTWGVITLEMQGVGTVLWAMTGWSLTACCLIGGLIAVLYVVFAGMKEVAWVNVINAVFMYVGVVIAAAILGTKLNGGWEMVNTYYTSQGQDWMLSLFANGNTWKTYIIGTILGQLFFVPINQAGCQCSISAKGIRTLKRSVIIAVPLNCVFGIFMIAFGMAAPAAGYDPNPIGTFAMLVDLLPTWVIIWLLAGFAAAILSTIAVCVLGVSTVFVNGLYRRYYKPEMTDAQQMKYLRIAIFVFGFGACFVSTLLPSVNTSMVWLFSWLLPAFWMFVFGMHWKRSSKACFTTTIVCAVVNCLWTFVPAIPAFFHLEGNNNSIAMLVITMLVGIITVAADKDAKPSMVWEYRNNRAEAISYVGGKK